MNITKMITVALMCAASLCSAMVPGHPQILKCPHCGQTKEIMSFRSGNTIGAKTWSDNKRIAPMLPEISYVQKCPHCAKYFILSRQKVVYAKSGYSSDCGSLSFAEAKEAFAQLSQEKFRNTKEEAGVRMLLHHAYNDYYFRNGGRRTVAEADQKLFRENALWLIENWINGAVMKAEFYREAGDMKKAKALIEKVSVDEEYDDDGDFPEDFVATIKKKIRKGETAVFLIESSKDSDVGDEASTIHDLQLVRCSHEAKKCAEASRSVRKSAKAHAAAERGAKASGAVDFDDDLKGGSAEPAEKAEAKAEEKPAAVRQRRYGAGGGGGDVDAF